MRWAVLTLLLGSGAVSSNDEMLAARCLMFGPTPDTRVMPAPQIAPGAPPALSFRFYEGKLHHRFGNGELLLDDAGH